jgi:murein L,D-transpeptidase YcbB/YkuD
MMRFSRAQALAVSASVMAVLVALPTPASAQNLFERLFRNERRVVVREAPPPEPAPVQRVAPPRVSGPSYYTYKVDALVKVDFTAIKPVRTEDAAMLPATGIDSASVGSTEGAEAEADRATAVQVAQMLQSDVASDAVPEDVGTGIETASEPAAIAEEGVDLENALVEGDAATAATEPDATEANDASDAVAAAPDSEPAVGVDLGAALVEEAAASDEIEPAAATDLPGGPTQPSSATAEAATMPATAANPATGERAPAEEEISAAPQPLSDAQIAALQAFELLAEQDAAEAIVAHYSALPELIWISDGRPNERARSALRTLGDAASHGLDPRDYAVTVPAATSDAEIARFEMELSARMLRYVRDARSGRIDPNKISGYHDFAAKPLDQIATLQGARTSEDVAAFLEAQHPGSEHYRALRVELEALRASTENEIVIAAGTLIKPGQTNAEFPKVLTLISQKADEAFRAEHGEVLTRHLGSQVYAQELVAVVKAAQRANGLGDDGVIGPRTVQALAGESKAGKIRKVEVALEQLRWLPSDLGERHVFINAASFDATYVEDGREKLSMRTVVGGLGTQTYFFQDEIEYVEFHPYWGVPRSILVNKYLPKLYSDPGYLDRNGFEVVNSKGQQVSSSSVNWGAYGANIPFDVRQKPGGGNALGEMKIMFPNRHAIYMHDTPDKALFNRDNRALSNGCVRLSDPRAMAAAVLGWSRDQVDQRAAGQHGRENLSVKLPVYVTYFTAWPTESGEVAYFGDVYSRDEKVMAAIEKVEELRAPAV